jgi:hypothetical protein
VIPKSEKQRQREEARKEDQEKREAVKERAEAERESVTIYKGDPFAPKGKTRTVAAESLEKPPPELPFKLTGKQRRELLDGEVPRITFPKDKPCPITVGEVYPVTSRVAFVVIGVGVDKTDWLLHYQPLDHRARHLGKAGDYSSSDKGAIATKQAPEKGTEPKEGQFRPEKEPEPVSKREQSKMTEEDRADRLKRMRGNLKILQDNLGRLERLEEASDVCWGVRRSITALKGRIERESRTQKEGSSPVAA